VRDPLECGNLVPLSPDFALLFRPAKVDAGRRPGKVRGKRDRVPALQESHSVDPNSSGTTFPSLRTCGRPWPSVTVWCGSMPKAANIVAAKSLT
jgi:hypothetical protein